MTDSFRARLLAAADAFRAGRFALALDGADAALTLSPGEPEALHLKALALGRLGRVDDAAPVYEQAARVHPQKAAVLSNLGNALSAAGRTAEAGAAYARAADADPRFVPALLGLAATKRAEGDDAQAEIILRRALALNPRSAAAHNALGLVLQSADRPDEAMAAFDAALAVDPDFVPALVNRGALRCARRNIDGALADLGTAARLKPQSPDAHYQLGNALRSKGDIGAAENALKRAIALRPGWVEAHRDLANMVWEAGRAEDFLSALDAAIAANHGSEAILDLRTELAMLAGDAAGAERTARVLTDRFPESAKGFMRLARLLRIAGDAGKAAALAQRAFALKPDDFETLHEYAEALLAAGSYAEAARVLDRPAPREHLVRHVALQTLAMRASGDARYQRFYDYDRLSAKLFIDPPPGYASVAAFNTDLLEALISLHAAQTTRPIAQTLYGGTQSLGRLWDEPLPVVHALKHALLKAAGQYVDQLPDDPDHPFLGLKTRDLVCAGAWSVILRSGGGHVDHFHPKGWISASYYVRIPPEVSAGDKAGFLRLGASGVAGLILPAERWIRPEEGAVILFPSYMWHGVEPFEAETSRVTAPFDLAPR